MSAAHHSVFYRPDALPGTQPTAAKYNFINSHTTRIRTIHEKGPDQFSKFTLPGLAESVPGPVVMYGNENCSVLQLVVVISW